MIRWVVSLSGRSSGLTGIGKTIKEERERWEGGEGRYCGQIRRFILLEGLMHASVLLVIVVTISYLREIVFSAPVCRCICR